MAYIFNDLSTSIERQYIRTAYEYADNCRIYINEPSRPFHWIDTRVFSPDHKTYYVQSYIGIEAPNTISSDARLLVTWDYTYSDGQQQHHINVQHYVGFAALGTLFKPYDYITLPNGCSLIECEINVDIYYFYGFWFFGWHIVSGANCIHTITITT